MLFLVAAGGGLALGALNFVSHRPPTVTAAPIAASAVTVRGDTHAAAPVLLSAQAQPLAASGASPNTAISAKIAPSSLPSSDPNFVSAAPLKLLGVTSPEAQRVLADLQNAYRCLHTGNKRALAAWMAAPASDAPASLDDLSASMRLSLEKLPDACYVTTALPQLMNPRTPAMLMEVLYDDLAHRPDPIKLRTLFLIAGSQSHPRAAEALQALQTDLSTNCQRDWPRWDQAISNQLTRESHGLRGMSCRMH